jgi:hypothetical protein
MLNACHTNNMIKHQISMDIEQKIKQKYPSTLCDQSNHHSIHKHN